jgi:hypothetical protein
MNFLITSVRGNKSAELLIPVAKSSNGDQSPRLDETRSPLASSTMFRFTIRDLLWLTQRDESAR